MADLPTIITFTGLVLLLLSWRVFVVVREREHAIKERLGEYKGTLGPGLHLLLPFFDRIAYRHELREQVIDIPPQSCITRDNIQVEVDGVVYLKVTDAKKASYAIGDYRQATVNLAFTTMRSEIGKLTLDETFSERDRVNEHIVREIDEASTHWGVKMIRYEIMNVTPCERVIETLEKQMEAERQKRAEITLSSGRKEAQIQQSEGERQEAINLSEGEKQRRINEASGRAAEIRRLAEASAEGLAEIARALSQPGGQAAVQMHLVEQFIEEFSHILQGARISVVPEQLANLKGFFEGLGGVATGPNPRV